MGIMVNGGMAFITEKASSPCQTAASLKASLARDDAMELPSTYIPMGQCTRESSSTTANTVRAVWSVAPSSLVVEALVTRVIGWTTVRMAEAKNVGVMVQSSTVS